jgi:hypothetical protein
VRTRSCCSISPPRPWHGPPRSRLCGTSARLSGSRSRPAAACARWMTRGACWRPVRTR